VHSRPIHSPCLDLPGYNRFRRLSQVLRHLTQLTLALFLSNYLPEKPLPAPNHPLGDLHHFLQWLAHKTVARQAVAELEAKKLLVGGSVARQMGQVCREVLNTLVVVDIDEGAVGHEAKVVRLVVSAY